MDKRQKSDPSAEVSLLEKSDALTILDHIHMGVLIVEADTHMIVYANPAALKIMGMSADEVIGRVCHEIICSSEKGRCPITDFHLSLDQSEKYILDRNEESVPVLKTATEIEISGRKYVLESFIDIRDRKRMQNKLEKSYALMENVVFERTRELIDSNSKLQKEIEERIQIESELEKSERKFKNIVTQSPMGILIYRYVDGKLVLRDSNKSAGNILQKDLALYVDRTTRELFDSVTDDNIHEIFANVAVLGENWHCEEFRYDVGDVGKMLDIYAFQSEPETICISILDVTGRKRMENELKRMALYDGLTGLANRTLCSDRINMAIARSKRKSEFLYSVLFIDIDRFKSINDSLGHQFGDYVIQETSRRLLKCVRSLDTVSRLGGDEFIVLLEDISSLKVAIKIVRRIQNEIQKVYKFEDKQINITASIGIELYPVNYTSADDVIRNANIAMQRAKDTGKNRFKVFTSNLLNSTIRKASLEQDIDKSIRENEFSLAYQPICTADGELYGMEVLARWNHHKYGNVKPNEFILIAEETGKISNLGLWIFEKSCQTVSAWLKNSSLMQDLIVSINISPIQFSQIGLVDSIKGILLKHDVPPHNVYLEITESGLMQNNPATNTKLTQLRKHGLRFSIDDFGTGYSNMSYLNQLPFDTLKVDLSFIKSVDLSAENREIVGAIIKVAKSLGLKVVAEGVERQSQLEVLKDMGCDLYQGYLFSRPLSAREFEEKYLRTTVNE